VGRAPRFWTAETVELIKKNCVAVSVSNYDQNRQDAVGQFVRDSGMKFPGAGGSHWFVTANGKVLGRDARQALARWKAIPESERAPGAIHVDPLGLIDSKRAAPTPPEGALIIKLHYRALMRDKDGGLRYVTGADLWHDEDGKKTEAAIENTYPGAITTPQAQPDHMWLTRTEWQSLMPARPRRGDKVPLPSAVANRLIRWHLNPLFVYGEANPLGRKEVRAAEMTLTVMQISANMVRLRLDGFARLGADFPAADMMSHRACLDKWGYEPRLLGHLEYDPQKKVFTRFDIVALGDHFGRLGICDSAARPGRQPLGIAFELVATEAPAERIPPGRTIPARTYFDNAK
jgi:hypothetical protein